MKRDSRWQINSILSLTSAVLLTGCPPADDGDLPDPDGQAISFSGDVQPIINARCTDCHRPGGFGPDSGVVMLLTSDRAYGDLVDQPSSQDGELVLVVPGDADASLLFQKVASNDPPVGSRMPLFGMLTADEIAIIRDWIDQGAADN